MKMTAAARRPVPRRAAALATVAATAALLLALPSPSGAVTPTPQAAGQTGEVDTTNPNDGGTYLGPTYTVPSGGDAFDSLYLGINQTGTVNHSSGTLTISQYFEMADLGGSNGTYNLSGTGTLNTLDINVGLNGIGVFNQSGGTDNVGSNGINLGSFSGANGTYTLSGGTLSVTGGTYLSYKGTGVFTQSGGTATLGGVYFVGGASTAKGTLNLNGGTLNVPSIALGDTGGGTSTFNFNGGTLQPTSSNGTTFFPNVLTAANVRNGGAIINTAGFNVTVGQRLVHSTLGGDNATDGGLTKSGTGTLTLSGANTYTGPTTVNGGTLQVGVASVAGTSGALGLNSAVSLANVAGTTLALNNLNTQIGSLTGGGTTGGNVTLGSATLTVGGNNTSPAAYAGVISGTGGLTKNGTGTLTLSGANTYNGATTVSAGTLLADNTAGSATGTGALTVQSGGTLGGTGAVAGAVTVQSGGRLDAGNAGATGMLTLASNLSLNTGATLGVQLGGTTAGTGYDQIRVAGTLTLGGTLSVTETSGFKLTLDQTFVIVDHTGTSLVTTAFANVPAGGLYTDAAGNTFQVNYAAIADGDLVPNDVTLTVQSVVPEPSTWALLAAGTAALGFALRRRAAARA